MARDSLNISDKTKISLYAACSALLVIVPAAMWIANVDANARAVLDANKELHPMVIELTKEVSELRGEMHALREELRNHWAQ